MAAGEASIRSLQYRRQAQWPTAEHQRGTQVRTLRSHAQIRTSVATWHPPHWLFLGSHKTRPVLDLRSSRVYNRCGNHGVQGYARYLIHAESTRDYRQRALGAGDIVILGLRCAITHVQTSTCRSISLENSDPMIYSVTVFRILVDYSLLQCS